MVPGERGDLIFTGLKTSEKPSVAGRHDNFTNQAPYIGKTHHVPTYSHYYLTLTEPPFSHTLLLLSRVVRKNWSCRIAVNEQWVLPRSCSRIGSYLQGAVEPTRGRGTSATCICLHSVSLPPRLLARSKKSASSNTIAPDFPTSIFLPNPLVRIGRKMEVGR